MTPSGSDLELRHPRGATAIRVGRGSLEAPGAAVERALDGRAAFVVSSEPVLRLHGDRLAELERRVATWHVLEVPVGESAKELDVAGRLWRELIRRGGRRDSVVVAFGGGTVGDLAGFVAAGFLRGVDYVQVPTTLLAQVDAAIGGKTAVNLPEAKNSVGLFHHPLAVLCDTNVLPTLDPAELRSGLFEVLKVGAIKAPALLETLDRRLEDLLGADAGALAPVVTAAIEAKVAIVEADPEERDQRRLLNFGHTLGHALESELGYRRLRHGEAVGYGMLFALELARRRGLDPAAADRIANLVRRIGLPELPALEPEGLLERMARDKKARRSGLAWVYPRAVGEGVVDEAIDVEEIAALLPGFLETVAGRT